jgi:hypothetical protein
LAAFRTRAVLSFAGVLEDKKQYEELFNEYSRTLAFDSTAKIIREMFD